MGDFDRHEKPKVKNQNKQVAFAISLGVVLIGVLGFHFMKQEPETASAAGGDAPAAYSSNDTPEDLGKQLIKDPAVGLLTGDTAVDPRLAKVPTNPFVMNSQWRASISPPPASQPGVVMVKGPDQTVVVRQVIPPLKMDSYKLGSIVRQGSNYMAILNGKIVSAGTVIDGARVVEIRADRVILQHPDFQ